MTPMFLPNGALHYGGWFGVAQWSCIHHLRKTRLQMNMGLLALMADAVWASSPSIERVICNSHNTAVIEVVQVNLDAPFFVDQFGRWVIVDARIERMVSGLWNRDRPGGKRLDQLRFIVRYDRGHAYRPKERFVMNYVIQSNGVRFSDVGGAWLIENQFVPEAGLGLDEFLRDLIDLRSSCQGAGQYRRDAD